MQKSVNDTVRLLGPMAPHTYLEAGLFVLLSVSAGLFEEIIFRGYLQRGLRTLRRDAIVGIVASGVLFCLAHGYQGTRMRGVIGFYGIFFSGLGAPAEEACSHVIARARIPSPALAFSSSVPGIDRPSHASSLLEK